MEKREEMVICKCGAWEDGIRTINASLQMSFIRGFNPQTITFKYCPWCSSKLITVEVLDGAVITDDDMVACYGGNPGA